MLNRVVVIALLFGAMLGQAYADESDQTETPQYRFEVTTGVDLEYRHHIDLDVPAAGIATLHQKYFYSPSYDPNAPSFHLQYRLWVTHDEDTRDGKIHDNFERIIAFVEKPLGDLRVSAGLMEVTWGENLLMPILDVVNVRDVTHPHGYYDANAKIPQGMVLVDGVLGEIELQLIGVPLPTQFPDPDEAAGFEVAEREPYEPLTDAEYGGRIGLLMLGVDTKLYYFKHFPRVPSYRFQAFSFDGDVMAEPRMGETYGLSLSYASLQWLYRADFAHHTNHPATNIGTDIERTGLTQAILGASWTSDQLDSIGVEAHFDHWQDDVVAFAEGAFVEDEGSQEFVWLGVTGTMSFWNNKVESFAFYLRGLQKEDEILRALAAYNFTDHFKMALEIQRTNALSSSPKLLLDQQKTAALRASYTF